MLATSSRRVTNALRVTTSRSVAQKNRSMATSSRPIPRGLQAPDFSAQETKKMQAWLDKVNADPTKKAALSRIVARRRQQAVGLAAFCSRFPSLVGLPAPESSTSLEGAVFVGIATCTRGAWSEYLYAVRIYQEKLQTDPAFLALHNDLSSKDKAVAKKATSTIVSFIDSIQTRSRLAKKGLLHLIRTQNWDGIKTGEAVSVANKYITAMKREMKVEVVTAHKLTPSEIEHYESRFKQLANDDRTSVLLTTKEDPSILGGSVVTINGKVFDQSWKTQQEKVMEAITTMNNL